MKVPKTRDEGLKIVEWISKGFPQELATEMVLGKDEQEINKELKSLLVKVIEQNSEIKEMVEKQKVVYTQKGYSEEDSIKMSTAQVLVEVSKKEDLKGYLDNLGESQEGKTDIDEAVDALSKLGEV
jgi:hypothetical protein